MKAGILYIAIFALALFCIPMIALGYELDAPSNLQPQVHAPLPAAQPEAASSPEQSAAEPEIEAAQADEEQADAEAGDDFPVSELGVSSFKILDQSTGEVVEVSLRDFVRGAVAAEMPVSFHAEALKAQAVAAHTYALHNHYAQLQNPDPALKGADFAADPANLKVYATEEGARAFYGDAADASWRRICEAADSVLPYIMEYDDEPIVAAYHAISAGQTEDAANVWEGSAPYLAPTDSEGDLLAPGYETVFTISAAELRTALEAAYPEIQLQADPAEWFGEPERSLSGYITGIAVGDETLHGKDLRTLLDLRSHNFDVRYTDAGFTFQVYGYGHGVGLSQYGADFLARQGNSFTEILANYYSGVTLRQIAPAILSE